MTTTEYNIMDLGSELHIAVCDWLRANRIDPNLVPGDEKPDCTYRGDSGTPPRGDTITTRVKVQAQANKQQDVIRYGANRIEHATITMPMLVPPPAIVQTWLNTRCPTCDRP